MPLGLADELIYTTVRIECKIPIEKAEGDLAKEGRSTGTAFFFNFSKNQDFIAPFLVTNKHVVKDAKSCIIYVTKSTPQNEPDIGNFEIIQIDDLQSHIIEHPDPDVDLTLIRFAPILRRYSSTGVNLFYKTFDQSLFPAQTDLDEITAIEEIVMIGYPNGLWDTHNNHPFVRRGITATPFYSDFCGRREFAIDAACYPGSSGSPIILFNQGSYATQNALRLDSRCIFLGILYAGPRYNLQGEIQIENVPTEMKVKVLSPSMINLGFCIKYSCLDNFLPLLDI